MAPRTQLRVLSEQDLQGLDLSRPSVAARPTGTLGLERGEEIAVRGLAEIRATLDARGALEGLPFMPEMERFAGQRARVYRRADRVCVEGAPTLRRLRDTVFLADLRCDGAAHEGCQRACLLLWKEAWLDRGAGEAPAQRPRSEAAPDTEAEKNVREGSRFSCQSTQLLAASHEMPAWRPDQYLRDLATGNLTPLELAQAFFATARHRVEMRITRTERRKRSKQTPRAQLGLQPGEWVVVKSKAEIDATLDPAQKNRGLELSPGMQLHCGRRCRVQARVERIIDEHSGTLRKLADTVMLEGVHCDGLCARGCPRRSPLYWREIWLRRAPPP